MNGFNLSNIQNAMLGSTQVSALYYGSKLIWENYHDYSIEYFTIEPTTSDGADVYVAKGTQNQSVNLSYSTDLINWTSVTINTYGNSYTLLDHIFYGDKMYIKGINNALSTGAGAGVRIYAIEPYKVYGNIMSLLYGDNFANQTSLPDHYSFVSLFNNSNNGLTDASNLILPATTLTGYCYSQMFQSCTQLTKAPALPATTLYTNCYYSMFRNCTSLTSAPALPATTLADYCYYFMFQGCTSLTSAPALPATTLAVYCYYSMFFGCSSLTSAPVLPATILKDNCYNQMFRNCTSLMYIKTLATDISATNSHYRFTYGVNTTGGTFIKNYNTQWPTGTDGIPSGWNVSNIYNVNIDNSIVGGTITSNIVYSLPNETVILTVTPDPHCILQSLTVVDANDNPVTVTNNQFTMPNSNVTVSAAFISMINTPLTIKALENNVAIKVSNDNDDCTLYYQINGGTEQSFVSEKDDADVVMTTLSNGDILTITSNDATARAYFTDITGSFKVYGNVMSLQTKTSYSSTTSLTRYASFDSLFSGCTGLVDAENLVLPATSGNSQYAYRYMFNGCTNLVKAPKTIAKVFNIGCNHMFHGCSSLITVPTIIDPTIEYGGCGQMFWECTSLVDASNIFTNMTTANNECFGQMFYGCTSLLYPPSISVLTTIPQGGCNQMFRGCTSLVNAPDINATTINTWGCYQMFYGCTKLNYVKCLATAKNGSSNFNSWLYKVSSTGTFVKDANSTLWGTGSSGIPSGWTVVNV